MEEAFKYMYALDLALTIIDSEDTFLTELQIRGMRAEELYDWLDAWEYEWDGRNWKLIERGL